MRIIISTATVAAFTRSGLTSANKEVIGRDVTREREQSLLSSWSTRDADESFEWTNGHERFLDEECNTFGPDSDPVTNLQTGLSDVGILGCGPNQICKPDGSSLLGGRCTMSAFSAQLKLPREPITMAAFSNRRGRRTYDTQQANRVLQQIDGNSTGVYEEQVCPLDCPQQFCDCAHADGDAAKCASELHSVCINDLLASCVPESFMSFYTDTYCPFAACIAIEGKAYEECSCEYYANYCDVYYAYMESINKCAISTCCDGQPNGMKYTCIPGMQPTGNPTMAPIFSPHPSSSPTMSSMPTISSAPTVSPVPTVTPTSSAKPTVSSAPTPLESSSPSEQPSLSTSPSTSSPTASSRPTTSPAPTEFPTVTAVPTVTSMPSVTPTKPELMAPTYFPTGAGLEIVPTTNATDSPESARSSGRVIHSTDIIVMSLLASLSGIMWFCI